MDGDRPFDERRMLERFRVFWGGLRSVCGRLRYLDGYSWGPEGGLNVSVVAVWKCPGLTR